VSQDWSCDPARRSVDSLYSVVTARDRSSLRPGTARVSSGARVAQPLNLLPERDSAHARPPLGDARRLRA